MAYLPLLLSLLVVDLLAAMSPGPNFVVVSHAALHRTPRHAGAVVVGIITANLAWSGTVVLGLSTLFELAPRLYGAIKFFGGAYLLYLGVQLWRSTGHAPTRVTPFERSLGASYVRGLLVALGNPKSVVYFGSVSRCS